MLDRSSKLDDSLMDAYRSIHELHKGHAAGESDIEKQASQLASDIRYKAKGRIKDGMNPEDKKRVYLSLLSSSSAPAIVKTKAKKKLLGESVIGEEGYDHWKDKELEHGGIGAVASRSPSRPYTRSEKQPKGDTAYQKEMKAKYGGKLPTAMQVVKDKYKGSFKESAADKIINSIRSKRVNEGKLVHGPFGPYITDQKMPKEQREVPLRDVPYEGLNGNRKAVGEEKEKYDNTKSPDYKKKKKALADKHGGEENIKGHPQYEEVTNEAKVDTVKHGVMDSPEKQQARNERKFGNQRFNQGGQTTLRRGLHWSRRGDKKVRGAKVEEEVGLSSSAAMKAAHNEAKLRKKEEAAVKKAKKVKNEEVALENRMASHTAGMSDAQKDMASNQISRRTADRMGRRNDEAAFGDRKRSGKRGNPQQYRASADNPEWEGRFPYGKSNIRQGKGSIKDLKNEYSPAVEKVIEAIKINKASPKSPNCIIMPKKDDITDKAGGKKSTKEVVTKKQKQFFNQEDKVKTFRQFVTETEYVDEGWGSLVKGAVKSGASLAKGTAKVGAEVAKGTAKEIGTAAGELSRGAGNVAKHGGRALQTGASEFKKTGSLSKGIEAGGQSMEKRKILSNPTKYAGVQGPVTKTGQKPAYTGKASDLNKQSKQNWRRTKAKIGKRAQQTKDALEVGTNLKLALANQENESQAGAGGKVGERQAPS